MKILLDKYPKGTLKNQKTDGRYVNEILYENLKIFAEKIVDDMTFLGIGFSSTLEVGTGKSVLFTQIGETWSYLMKEIHNLDIPFTTKNIVWRPKELMERAFDVPKYSCIILDEWEDQHYWSEMGMTLRQFFRKCRQLNLFILVIIPNFFQMPMNYAISRSVFAIDVRFTGKFERGTAEFYNFDDKRKLYVLGKKTQNYKCVKSTFIFSFTDGYGVNEEEYRRAKLEDMKKWDENEKNIKKYSPEKIKHSIVFLMRNSAHLWDKKKPTESLAKIFGVSTKSIREWMLDVKPDFIDDEENDLNLGFYKPKPAEFDIIQPNSNNKLLKSQEFLNFSKEDDSN